MSGKRSGRKTQNRPVHSHFSVINRAVPPSVPSPFQLTATSRNETYKFQAYQTFTWTTSSITVPVTVGNYFTFGGLGFASSLATVFDQYRVRRIQVLLQPGITQTTDTVSEPALWASAVDQDNAGAPASLASMISKPGTVVSGFTSGHYHSWVPSIAIDAYNGAFTGYANADSQWIDCTNTNVQYYGLKSVTEVSNVAIVIKAIVLMDVELRGIAA
jgi:hypothetical protein